MGLQHSKDRLLYEQASHGDVEAIKTLRNEGAGLEWTDREGKTPLTVACTRLELYNVAITLIESGANVNAYQRGRNGGTPLHHAARRGLLHTVKLLLSHGANVLAMNDNYQTPIDIARAKGYNNVVRALEGHVCLFSGWLMELYGPSVLDLLAPQLLSRRVWVVVLPCGSRNKRKPYRLELAIYSNVQDAQPRTIAPLWKANLEEIDLNRPSPVATVSNISRIPKCWRRRRAIKSSQEAKRTRIKLAPQHETEKEQLQQFSNACKGIPQVTHPSFPVPAAPAGASFPIPTSPAGVSFPVPTAPFGVQSMGAQSASKDKELSMATNDSIYCASTSSTNVSNCDVKKPVPSNFQAKPLKEGNKNPFAVVHTTPENPSPVSTPSVPPPIEKNPVISSPSVTETSSSVQNDKEENTASSCTICLDAPVEGACIPCGHMVGCMSCLNEIKTKKFGCPVCRSQIDQVVRIYAA